MNPIIQGEVNGVKYSIEQSAIDDLKQFHNVDAVAEIKKALLQETQKEQNED